MCVGQCFAYIFSIIFSLFQYIIVEDYSSKCKTKSAELFILDFYLIGSIAVSSMLAKLIIRKTDEKALCL